jgi:hypothetical protein
VRLESSLKIAPKLIDFLLKVAFLMRIDVVQIANTYAYIFARIRFWDSLRLSTEWLYCDNQAA